MEKKKILFVCTGNTCRSSMAEALFKDMLNDGQEKYEVSSAGLAAIEGQRAANQAIEVMKEENIDLTDHETTLLTEDLIEESDLILTMTQRHKFSIIDSYDKAKEKVYTLKEYAARVEEIEKETELIEQVYQQIDKKRSNFLKQYGTELEELKQKRKKMINQLEEIERRITELEDKLATEMTPLKRKLAKIKGNKSSLNVCDPFGQPISIYRSCAQEIKDELKKIVENL